MKTTAILLALLLSVPMPSGGDVKAFKPKRAASINESVGVSILIVGPESVQPGTLVKLDASQSDGQSFSWKLASTGGSSELYEVSDDGKKVYFSSPVPGKYSFILAVAKANTDPTKAPALTLAEHLIVVQGVAPQPNNPVNPVTPQPNVPVDPLTNGRFGLTRFTRDLIVSAIPADKRSLAASFSVNYNLLSSQLKDGTVTGLTNANQFLLKKNQATAGTAIDVWKPGVFVPLAAKLSELVKSGVIDVAKPADLIDLYSEIGLGFAAATGN